MERSPVCTSRNQMAMTLPAQQLPPVASGMCSPSTGRSSHFSSSLPSLYQEQRPLELKEPYRAQYQPLPPFRGLSAIDGSTIPYLYRGTGQPLPESERPFKCDECIQSFRRNHDLKRHKRIHLGVKPFPCTSCGKSFSRKDALKRHRLAKGCGVKSKTKELAALSRPKSFESNDSGYISDGRENQLTFGNGVRPPMVKSETDPRREGAETFPALPLPNYSQQHIMPFPPTLPQDLDSRVSSQAPESDGSSSVTETYIDERKRKIVDSIVSNVTRWLHTIFDSIRKSASGNPPGAAGTPNESQGSSCEANSSNPLKPSHLKRKFMQMNDGETDEDNEEGHGEGQQRSDRSTENHEERKYACPYFKYDPTKYKSWRACIGPGWTNTHRVKEHLYRRHRQPAFRCQRCWQPFKDEKCHLDHLRTDEACPLREMEPIEGFDAAQERSLKSRKKPHQELSEIDKWRRVFKILFPHVLDDDIPSPFYEYNQLSEKDDNHQHSDFLAQCEDYMVREVPQQLRQVLGRELDRDLTIVEESLRLRASDLVKTLLEEAFRKLRQNRGSSQPFGTNAELDLPIEGPSLPDSQTGSSESSEPRDEGDNDTWLSHFDFNSFDPSMFLGETEFSFDNGGLLENLFKPGDGHDIETRKHSDSGYGSHSPIQSEK